MFTDTQLRIPKAPANARISLRADMSTGGSRDAATIKTFRPFFHAQLYQTIMGYLTPANSVDAGIRLLADPGPKLTLQAYARRFWRYAMRDVIYGRGFASLTGTGNYDSNAVGDLIAASGRIQFNKHLSFTLNGGIFSPSADAAGSGLRNTKTLTPEMLYMFKYVPSIWVAWNIRGRQFCWCRADRYFVLNDLFFRYLPVLTLDANGGKVPERGDRYERTRRTGILSSSRSTNPFLSPSANGASSKNLPFGSDRFAGPLFLSVATSRYKKVRQRAGG